MQGFITTKQAAALLGVTEKTVYYYARDYGDFPQPERFGRSLLWRKEPLEQWRSTHPPREKPDAGQ